MPLATIAAVTGFTLEGLTYIGVTVLAQPLPLGLAAPPEDEPHRLSRQPRKPL